MNIEKINEHDLSGQDQTKSKSFLLILLCLYIFLLIDRPWESISYVYGWRIQFCFAILMVFVAVFTGRLTVRQAPTNFWVFGLLAIHFLLAPFAFSPSGAVGQGYEYFKIVLLYLLIVSVADDEADLKTLLKAYALSTVLYTLHSLWEYSNGRCEYRMGIVRMLGVGEVHSNPNAFGASLVLSIPLVFVLAKFELVKWLRWLWYGYLVVLVPVCVVLTGSRSAFVTMLLCGLIGVWTLKGSRKYLGLAFALAVVVVGWHYMPEEKQERIQTLWNQDAGPANAHESSRGRLEGFLISIEMFKQRPFTGVGAGGENYIGYRVAMGEPAFQAHNLYGEVLAEFGISGAFFFNGSGVGNMEGLHPDSQRFSSTRQYAILFPNFG